MSSVVHGVLSIVFAFNSQCLGIIIVVINLQIQKQCDKKCFVRTRWVVIKIKRPEVLIR